MEVITYTWIEESADRFVVADGERRVAGVGPLPDLCSSVEDSVTPGGRTVLLTENKQQKYLFTIAKI